MNNIIDRRRATLSAEAGSARARINDVTGRETTYRKRKLSDCAKSGHSPFLAELGHSRPRNRGTPIANGVARSGSGQGDETVTSSAASSLLVGSTVQCDLSARCGGGRALFHLSVGGALAVPGRFCRNDCGACVPDRSRASTLWLVGGTHATICNPWPGARAVRVRR